MNRLAADIIAAVAAQPSKAERRRAQVLAALARWKRANPQKVAAQRKRWRERRQKAGAAASME